MIAAAIREQTSPVESCRLDKKIFIEAGATAQAGIGQPA
jgi:hypothetical protein